LLFRAIQVLNSVNFLFQKFLSVIFQLYFNCSARIKFVQKLFGRNGASKNRSLAGTHGVQHLLLLLDPLLHGVGLGQEFAQRQGVEKALLPQRGRLEKLVVPLPGVDFINPILTGKT
jgi:hypothetical protein